MGVGNRCRWGEVGSSALVEITEGRRFCKDFRMSLAWRRNRFGSEDGSSTDG